MLHTSLFRLFVFSFFVVVLSACGGGGGGGESNGVSDSEAVEADRVSLVITYGANNSESNVTQNIGLPTTGLNGTTITWESDSATTSIDGSVTRPVFGSGNESVTLTATIERNGTQDTKLFTLTVIEAAQTDAEAVAADKAGLVISFSGSDSANDVTQHLGLPTTGSNGTTITWVSRYTADDSDATAVLSGDGVVYRPTDNDAQISLTATISKGVDFDTKTFSLTVKVALLISDCTLHFPQNVTITDIETINIFGRVLVQGLTDQSASNNVHVDLVGAAGYGPSSTMPSNAGNWTWFPANENPGYTGDAPTYDEYVGSFNIPTASVYDMAYRFSGDGGVTWTYCDINGSADGYQTASSGVVTVQEFVAQLGGSIQGISLNLTAEVSTLAGTAGSIGSVDGAGSTALFWYPNDITTDGANLYVTDNGNDTIRKIEISTGSVTTLAGSPGVSGFADGTGSLARFSNPTGITTDGTNLFVSEFSAHVVRKIVIDSGVVTTLAGTAGPSGSADGTGAFAQFYRPRGITTDGTNLYVADSSNHTVRKIVISTGAVTTLAGTAGTTGNTDGAGTDALFNDPHGITTDGTNLYVTDAGNNTIRKVVIATGAVSTFAGNSSMAGISDGTGTAAEFWLPTGITSDGSNLYVMDGNNQTLRKIVINTGVVTTLAGSAGSAGSTDGIGSTANFFNPVGVSTDSSSLYIVDNSNHTIRQVD